MGENYKDLIAWKKAMELVTEVYQATQGFPKEEIYSLTSQIRRAAISVPSNIAEGRGRASKGEFKQFLGVARGSLLELETQLIIASNLNYLDNRQLQDLLNRTSEVGRILNGLKSSIK